MSKWKFLEIGIIAALLAVIGLAIEVSETLITGDPYVMFAFLGLVLGVAVPVIVQFHKKIRDGELNWRDFNPIYLIIDIAPLALIWTVFYQEALSVIPPSVPPPLGFGYVFVQFVMRGAVQASLIDIVAQWVFLAWKNRNKT